MSTGFACKIGLIGPIRPIFQRKKPWNYHSFVGGIPRRRLTPPVAIAVGRRRRAAHGGRLGEGLDQDDDLSGRLVLVVEHLGVAPVGVPILLLTLGRREEHGDARIVVGRHLAFPDFLDLEVGEFAQEDPDPVPALVALTAVSVDEVAAVDGADLEGTIRYHTGPVELDGLVADARVGRNFDSLLDELQEVEGHLHVDPEGLRSVVGDEGLATGAEIELTHDVVALEWMVVADQDLVAEHGNIAERQGEIHDSSFEASDAHLGLGGRRVDRNGRDGVENAPDLGDRTGDGHGDAEAGDVLEGDFSGHGFDSAADADQVGDHLVEVAPFAFGEAVVEPLENVFDFFALEQGHGLSFPFSLSREGSVGGFCGLRLIPRRGKATTGNRLMPWVGKELAPRHYPAAPKTSRVLVV